MACARDKRVLTIQFLATAGGRKRVRGGGDDARPAAGVALHRWMSTS